MNHDRVSIVLLLTGIVAYSWVEPGGVLSAGQGDAAKATIQERLKRAGAELLSGTTRVDEAIREPKAILAVDPRSAEGHLFLGVAYRMLGSAELMGEAKAELRQALALNPGLVPARFYLAHVYLDLGRAARAREELETVLVQHPGHPQFLALLGEAERQLGNPRRALEVNRQALKVDESFAQARYYAGLALFDLGQRDEAIRELERVVESGPDAVEAYLGLGTGYIEAGRLDEALKALQQGTRIDPSRPDLRIQLARAYRSKGLLDEAEEQLKLATPPGAAAPASLFHQQVESDLFLEDGRIQRQRGRLEAAAEAFRKVLDRDPSHGPTNRHLAEVYLLQGSYTRALEHATRAETLGFPLPDDQRKRLHEMIQSKDTGRRK